MAVYMVYDQGHNEETCQLWNKWSMRGFTDRNNDIHQLAELIDFPKNRYKSIKALCKYLIEQIPILDKYIKIVNQSKDIAPICYISKPKVIPVWKKKKDNDIKENS